MPQTSRRRIKSVPAVGAAFDIIDHGMLAIVAEIAADHAHLVAARKPVKRRTAATRVRKAA